MHYRPVQMISAVGLVVAAVVVVILLANPWSDEPREGGALAPDEGGAPTAPSAAETVEIAGTVWPLAFESPAPSAELRRLIAEDLASAFGGFELSEMHELSPGREVTVDGKVAKVDRFLRLGMNEDYIFSAPRLATDFGDIVSVGGVWHLLVSRDLADAYEASPALTADGRKAFSTLDAFLTRINSIDPDAMTDSDLTEIFHPRMVGRMSADALHRNAVGLSELRVGRPSPLGCQLDDEGMLGCRAVTFVKSTGKRNSEIWLAHQDGRWYVFGG